MMTSLSQYSRLLQCLITHHIRRSSNCLKHHVTGLHCCATNFSSQNVKHQFGAEVEILHKTYATDQLTNVTPTIISKVGRNLHQRPGHPLHMIYKRIESYFHRTHVRRGNPIFSAYDNLHPVVTHEQNFDSLLVPKKHVSRLPSDTYYVNSDHMLRAHTSAHQRDLMRSGLDAFIVAGDVYRRDTIDSTHYPVFHQVEGVRLFSDFELFSKVKDQSSVSLFELSGSHTEQKQESHSLETAMMVGHDLKKCLEGLMKALFQEDLEMKWVDAYFPFTHPSWELEIFHQGEWIEMLGCGIMEQNLVNSAGATNKAGWAFGLGLERLAMKLFSIPDIRLFWSQDPGFLRQFQGKEIGDNVTFKPVSKFPPCTNDISFWIPESFSSNDFYDLVRTVGGDLVEHVSLFDEFLHPKKGRRSHSYRIVYRHMEKTLSQNEVNELHSTIEAQAKHFLGVEIR